MGCASSGESREFQTRDNPSSINNNPTTTTKNKDNPSSSKNQELKGSNENIIEQKKEQSYSKEDPETLELKSIPLNSEYGKTIFKTKINNIESNGFLCKLPIFVSGSVLPVMIFSSKVLGVCQKENKKIMEINHDNNICNVHLFKHNYIYYNDKEYSVAIVETNSCDKLELNNFIFGEPEKYYNKSDIMNNSSLGIINYNEKNQRYEFAQIKIKNIKENEYEIDYISNLTDKANYLPIYDIQKDRVIGYQIAKNKGILLKLPMLDYKQQIMSILKEYMKITDFPPNIQLKEAAINPDEIKFLKEIDLIYTLVSPFPYIKILGEEFVEKNKGICFLKLFDEEQSKVYICDICSFLNIEFASQINGGRGNITIKLIQTDYVTDLSKMFSGCTNLMIAQGFNQLNTEKNKSISGMFENCRKLLLMNMSDFNTSEVTDMSYMFKNCHDILEVHLNNFDTNKLTTMKGMFENCHKLKIIKGLNIFSMNNVTDISFMFKSCETLEETSDISNWDTSKVINMDSMFQDCKSLEHLCDISKWSTKSLKNKNNMFLGCDLLKEKPKI